jgi:hypothetical protein
MGIAYLPDTPFCVASIGGCVHGLRPSETQLRLSIGLKLRWASRQTDSICALFCVWLQQRAPL